MIEVKRLIYVLLAIALMAGCTPLTQEQKAEYDLMAQDNVLVEKKKPGTGVALGFLPGFGSFYAREPVVGVVDLLLWPISVLWDPVVGFEMSKKVNYELTTAKLERQKEKELSELENQRDLSKITETEYVTTKRQLEQRYDYKRETL